MIHAVGPIYNDGRSGEPELLASAYCNSLQVAVENNVTSIAFPSLSTGAYGYPLRDAANVALETVRQFLQSEAQSFKLVRFVLFDARALEAFDTALGRLVRKL